MKIHKKVISNLTKCYSIAPLHYRGQDYFLVAAEKEDPCYLFDLDGNQVDKIWDGPGGVMSMVQVPGSDGQFLATYKFYSPNDSKEAKIVIVTPTESGQWEIRTLVSLPHVHRFDLLERNGTVYLIACALKSGHEYKEDWSMPGKVYAAQLPADLSDFGEDHQLELSVLKDNMLKNHGYYRVEDRGVQTAVISCNEGVFQFVPPAQAGEKWEIRTLLESPVSDAVLVDLDGDGEKELCTLAPFHGEKVSIYKKADGAYHKVYDYPEDAEFTHAIYGGKLCGKPAFVAGHRKGKRNLFAIVWNPEKKRYEEEIIDQDRGPANVFHYLHNGKDVLIAANRETDEVAMYIITE
ncbi:MAG: hypothetical protein Q4D16_03095 [Eubacteriales bacterium]|nr:hypothetical protein [Eubacteriales bacterium]